MTSHRSLPSTRDGLPTVAIGAALMAAAPSGGRWLAANAGGDAPSQKDRGAASARPSGHPPDWLAARPVVASSRWRSDRC